MIEQGIHEILTGDDADAVALALLLAPDRIVTGTNHDRELPYASVNLESNTSRYRSNNGSIRRKLVRFQLWHDNHAAGCAIRDAIELLFENKSFTLDEQKIVSAHHENSLAIEEPDGVWQFLIDFAINS